jgi:hypothetical protein
MRDKWWSLWIKQSFLVVLETQYVFLVWIFF